MTPKAAWQPCGTCHRIFDSLRMSVIPATVDPTEKARLCVKNFIRVKNATKSCRTRKGSTKITYAEERCVGLNCEEFVDPNKQPMLYEADSQARRVFV